MQEMSFVSDEVPATALLAPGCSTGSAVWEAEGRKVYTHGTDIQWNTTRSSKGMIEILTWMQLEIIIPSGISPKKRQTNTMYDIHVYI